MSIIKFIIRLFHMIFHFLDKGGEDDEETKNEKE